MRWRILGLLFLARTGLGVQFQTMGSVGDDLVVAFGLDYAEIGLLIGLFMTPGLFLALPAGISGRYLSDRSLVAFGLIALALGGALSAAAPDSWTVGAGRVLAGAGFLFAALYFSKMTADWFEGREIATAMSVLVMSWPFGIAMAQVGHAWLADAYGWRAPFQAASLYCALAATAVFVVYRPPQGQPPAKGRMALRLSGIEWRLIVLAGTAWGVFNAGYVVYLTFGPSLLISLGSPALAAAAVISAGSWVMIFSGAACGQIADGFGRREVILGTCMAGAIAALIILSLPGAALAASLLFGLVGMAPAGIIMALASEAVGPERRAFAMGVFFTVYYVVMSATPPLAGWLYDSTGWSGTPLLLGMALFAAVVPLSLTFRALKTRDAAVLNRDKSPCASVGPS